MKFLSILYVDDDKVERLKFRKVCRTVKAEFNVFEAINGEEAFAILENNFQSFDLVITDINMPRMDGFEFLSKLKSSIKYNKIPVVVMSTSESNIDLEKAYQLGVSGYFSKPLKYIEYKKKVTSLLEYWDNVSFVN